MGCRSRHSGFSTKPLSAVPLNETIWVDGGAPAVKARSMRLRARPKAHSLNTSPASLALSAMSTASPSSQVATSTTTSRPAATPAR